MACSAKRLVAVRPNRAVHATLHDRVTAVDRGCAATGADRVHERADPLLQLPGQSHSEGSRGIAEISERGSGILGRGPQCDEVGRDLKGVALVDAAYATTEVQPGGHVWRLDSDLEFEEIVRPAAQAQLGVTKQDRRLNTGI